MPRKNILVLLRRLGSGKDTIDSKQEMTKWRKTVGMEKDVTNINSEDLVRI